MSKCQVLYDFAGDPSDPEQLTIRTGETITLGEDAGGGWIYATTAAGVRGIVPAGYLSSPVADDAIPDANLTASSPQESIPAAPPSAPEPAVESSPIPSESQHEEAIPPQSSESTTTNDPKYAKYAKMRKAGLPEDAIRHAMAKDNVDPGNFFGAASSSAGSSTTASDTGAESADPRIEKYKKMQKTGLPEGAIRNAMARDGVDPSLMFGGPPQSVTPPKPLIIAKKAAAQGSEDLSQHLKSVQLKSTPTTPPKAAADPATPPKAEVSPFDEVKKRALERQKRLESAGGLLTEFSGAQDNAVRQGGAQSSPPDKSQWKPNLRKADDLGRGHNAPAADEAEKPNWSAGLKKTQPPASKDFGKKRTQEDADVATEAVAAPPAPRVKAAKACAHYKLDTTAAQFGDCTCGHSKSAHDERHGDSAAHENESHPVKNAPSEPGVSHVSAAPAPEPCGTYHVDMKAKEFGMCVCGHREAQHLSGGASVKPRVSDSSHLVLPAKPARKSSDKATEPCANFEVDVSAAEFGTCTCGFKKHEHMSGKQKIPTLEAKMGQRASSSPSTEKGSAPCSHFKIDVGASSFDTCQCGYKKSDHGKVSASPDAATFASSTTTHKNEKTAKPCQVFRLDMMAPSFGTCVCGHARAKHGIRDDHENDDEDGDAKPAVASTDTPTSAPVDAAEENVESVQRAPTKSPQEESGDAFLSAVSSEPTSQQETAEPPLQQESTEPARQEQIEELAANQQSGEPTGAESAPSTKHLPETPVSTQDSPQEASAPQPAGAGPRRSAPPPPGASTSEEAHRPREGANAAPIVSAANDQHQAARPPRAAPPAPEPSAAQQTVMPATEGAPRLRAPPPPPGAVDMQTPQHQPQVMAPPQFRAPPAPPAVVTAPPAVVPAPHSHMPPPPGVHGPGQFRAPPPPPGSFTTPATNMAPPAMQPPPRSGPFAVTNPSPDQYGSVDAYGRPIAPHSYGGAPGYGAQIMAPPPHVNTGFVVPPPPISNPMTSATPVQRKWMCSRCTYENDPSAAQCLICELKRPGPPQPQQQQQPPLHHQQQQPFVPMAVAMGAPPPRSSAVPVPMAMPQRGGEWNCERCTYLNPPARGTCEICEYPRPGPPTAAQMTQRPQQAPQSARNPFDPFW